MKVREGYYSEQIRNKSFAFVNLNQRQKEVFEIIAKWQPISNESIADHLNVFPHQITPRVYELRELGMVEFAGEGQSRISNRKISLWRINTNGTQLSLF